MRYCKAFPLSKLAAFPGWKQLAGDQAQADAEFAYLWPDFTVTSSPFAWDKVYVVRSSTPEWEAFCSLDLGFSPPAEIPGADRQGSGGPG